MSLVKKKLQWSASVVLVALGLLTGVGACGGSETLCDVAAAHVKACTGLEWATDTCDAEQSKLAETALSFDCEAFQERKPSSGWLPGNRLHDEGQMDDATFSYFLSWMHVDQDDANRWMHWYYHWNDMGY